MKLDLMVDIETVSTDTKQAAMIQLAGVWFDRYTGDTYDEFAINIDLIDSLQHGFSWDQRTIDWWIATNKDLFVQLLSNSWSVQESMASFNHFIRGHKILGVWSHSTFDIPIIQNYLKATGFRLLPYKKVRDIRTLIDLSGIDLKQYDWSNKTHNALDDCKFQIKYCVDAISALKRKMI